jgi:hypothetical protein
MFIAHAASSQTIASVTFFLLPHALFGGAAARFVAKLFEL